MKMRTQWIHLLILSSAVFLAACSKPTPPEAPKPTQQAEQNDETTAVMVFDTTIPVTCENTNSLSKSKERLNQVGVTPSNSQCAQLENAVFATVCGSPSGIFYIHEIQADELTTVASAGFSSLEEINEDEFFGTFKNKDGDVEFVIVECP